MSSITTWRRLEPRARESDVQIGLQARVHDPLWLLGRQWQVGEFKGEDAGSPVVSRLEADSFGLTRYLPRARPSSGAATGQALDTRTTPLETISPRLSGVLLRAKIARKYPVGTSMTRPVRTRAICRGATTRS